jgi:transposase
MRNSLEGPQPPVTKLSSFGRGSGGEEITPVTTDRALLERGKSGRRQPKLPLVTKLAYRTECPNGFGMTSTDGRHLLERWLKSPTTPQRVARRSLIVLLALQGLRQDGIAAAVGVSLPTVKLWLDRFASFGPSALLHDAPGRGRPASLNPTTMRDQLRTAGLLDTTGKPVSLRRAAMFLGVSTSSVWRALKRDADERANGAQVPRRHRRS